MSKRVQEWVDGYIAAWSSNEPADIRALFTDDATYYAAPFHEPWRGAENIVAQWLAHKDGPGDASFTWRQVGEDGDRAFVQGETVYEPTTFSNLWVIDFAPGGRATSFTDWWMDQSEPDE